MHFVYTVYLGMLAELQETTISFVVSVHLSAWNNLAPTKWIFMNMSSTCFRHHYAHHQQLESIIQVVAACRIWCFGFQVAGMVWS